MGCTDVVKAQVGRDVPIKLAMHQLATILISECHESNGDLSFAPVL